MSRGITITTSKDTQGTINTISLNRLKQEIKNNPDFDQTSVHLITRSDKLSDHANANGWNYMPSLAPSWELYNLCQQLKREGKWNEDTFDTVYVKSFYKGISNPQGATDLLRIIDRLESSQSVYIVCYCTETRKCHRRLIAESLQKATGREIEHIS